MLVFLAQGLRSRSLKPELSAERPNWSCSSVVVLLESSRWERLGESKDFAIAKKPETWTSRYWPRDWALSKIGPDRPCRTASDHEVLPCLCFLSFTQYFIPTALSCATCIEVDFPANFACQSTPTLILGGRGYRPTSTGLLQQISMSSLRECQHRLEGFDDIHTTDEPIASYSPCHCPRF